MARRQQQSVFAADVCIETGCCATTRYAGWMAMLFSCLHCGIREAIEVYGTNVRDVSSRHFWRAFIEVQGVAGGVACWPHLYVQGQKNREKKGGENHGEFAFIWVATAKCPPSYALIFWCQKIICERRRWMDNFWFHEKLNPHRLYSYQNLERESQKWKIFPRTTDSEWVFPIKHSNTSGNYCL